MRPGARSFSIACQAWPRSGHRGVYPAENGRHASCRHRDLSGHDLRRGAAGANCAGRATDRGHTPFAAGADAGARCAKPERTGDVHAPLERERLTYTVALGDTTVLEPSPLAMTLDGYELSTGVATSGVARDEVQESYPWSGAQHGGQRLQRGAAVADQ